jgi:hypothetical protein
LPRWEPSCSRRCSPTPLRAPPSQAEHTRTGRHSSLTCRRLVVVPSHPPLTYFNKASLSREVDAEGADQTQAHSLGRRHARRAAPLPPCPLHRAAEPSNDDVDEGHATPPAGFPSGFLLRTRCERRPRRVLLGVQALLGHSPPLNHWVTHKKAWVRTSHSVFSEGASAAGAFGSSGRGNASGEVTTSSIPELGLKADHALGAVRTLPGFLMVAEQLVSTMIRIPAPTASRTAATRRNDHAATQRPANNSYHCGRHMV